MIPLSQAKDEKFSRSTLPELREYCDQLGITYTKQHNGEALRRMLFESMGLGEPSMPAAAEKQRAKVVARTKEPITPPYNLTPEGLWGGRRRRVSIPRPEGSKMAKAELFGWNGKKPYYLPYGEVHAIPEPIYHILRENKRRRPVEQHIPIPGTMMQEVTTAFEFDDTPFTDHGVDPDTAHLAGSLTEWYQQKPPSWYKDRSDLELGVIVRALSLLERDKEGKRKPRDEILGELFVFLYGHPDVEDAAAA
jgi:hypothetical protein